MENSVYSPTWYYINQLIGILCGGNVEEALLFCIQTTWSCMATVVGFAFLFIP